MKNIIAFLLGVFLTISLVAMAQKSGVTIFQPAKPDNTLVKIYDLGALSSEGSTERKNMVDNINQMVGKGWIVKNTTVIQRNSYTRSIMVVYEYYKN